MSYGKAWRTRKCAWASKYGTLEELYSKLSLWYVVLDSTNTGSLTCIETNSENRFNYYFMAWKARKYARASEHQLW